jgi:hypothetical protein
VSHPPHAADLVTAIDRLLDALQVYRRQEHGLSVQDSDELHLLYRKVNHLALAGGLSAPPPLVQAGLVNYNHLIWPPQLYPNRDAGKEWELALRSLQTEARETQGANETLKSESDSLELISGGFAYKSLSG